MSGPILRWSLAGGVRINRPFRIGFSGLSEEGMAQYAGLVESNVGLYQINFAAPRVPADLPPCDARRLSNVTMTVQGTSSSDQASFCVQP